MRHQFHSALHFWAYRLVALPDKRAVMAVLQEFADEAFAEFDRGPFGDGADASGAGRSGKSGEEERSDG